MSVIVVDFRAALRAQIDRMAAKHAAMQAAIGELSPDELPEHLRRLEEHAEKLSRLASRLMEET
jgi:isopenicillin N synthase-like dioxygenase